MEECIGIWFGGNHTIDGNEYIHPSITGTIDLESNYREVSTFDKNDFRNDLPKRFIGVATLNFSPTIYERGFLHIKNNSANAITEEFFYDQWSGGKFIEDVSIENNHIVFWPNIKNSKTHLVNSNHSGDIVNFVDKNNYVNIMNSNFFAYSENQKFGDNCLVIPNNSQKRIYKKRLTNELKIKNIINNLNKSDILESEKLLQLIIRPYSRLSSFQCNFNSTVLSSNDDTIILVSLYKGSIPIQSKFYHAPKANLPLNIEFSHLDTPRLHDKVTYSIRIASYSNEETELVFNSETYSILGENHTTFTVKEI